MHRLAGPVIFLPGVIGSAILRFHPLPPDRSRSGVSLQAQGIAGISSTFDGGSNDYGYGALYIVGSTPVRRIRLHAGGFVYSSTEQWDRWSPAYPAGFVSTELFWSRSEVFLEGVWADSEDANVLLAAVGFRVRLDRGRFRLGSGAIRLSNGSNWPNPPLFSWTFTGRHRAA